MKEEMDEEEANHTPSPSPTANFLAELDLSWEEEGWKWVTD